MTREQAKQNLVTIGIEEPTDEQITNYLNQVNGETIRERGRADKYKEDAAKASDLQKQLDELNNKNLSDIERANKERDDALDSVASVRKELETMRMMASLAEKGIVGDDAKNLIKDDGSLDIETLGKIIAERETSAAAAKEKELLDKTPNPDGGTGGGNDGKTDAERLVEQIMPKKEASNENILQNYI